MKLATILKTAAFATATMFFLGCSEAESTATDPGTPKPATGTIEFAILGEDVPYANLEYSMNLKSATIDYAYMLVQNPTLMPTHEAARAARHVGETLEGKWAVDLMAKDANRTPVHLGYYADADTGYYENYPKITIAKAGSWDGVTDKGGLAKLQEKNVAFLFGGTFVDSDGNTHKYEIQEPLPSITLEIEEYPTDANGEAGTKLYVPGGDTLLAEYHPHIDHALEVLDENAFDFASLEKEGDTIIFSDTKNAVVTDLLGSEIKVYQQIVGHINRGDHWDVNVIPEAE